MARISRKHCAVCDSDQTFVNGRCGACKKKKTGEEEEKWSAMSVDDRLLDLHRRVKQLEQGPRRF